MQKQNTFSVSQRNAATIKPTPLRQRAFWQRSADSFGAFTVPFNFCPFGLLHYGTFALVKGARGRDEKQLSTEVSLKEKFIWTLFLDLFLLGSLG